MVFTTPSKAALLSAPDKVHDLAYYPIHGMVGCIRSTLVLSDEEYSFINTVPQEWPTQKPLTPFGHLPVLHAKAKDGQTLELAETLVIEQYLAKRANLLGKDAWEETLIKMYQSSTHSVFALLVYPLVPLPKEDRPAFVQNFKKARLANWIRAHEKHLQENGANGHYVGDQLSLADIKTASVLEHLIRICAEDEEPMISEKATPGLMAVKHSLEKNPRYAKWIQSEQYQAYTGANIGMLGF